MAGRSSTLVRDGESMFFTRRQQVPCSRSRPTFQSFHVHIPISTLIENVPKDVYLGCKEVSSCPTIIIEWQDQIINPALANTCPGTPLHSSLSILPTLVPTRLGNTQWPPPFDSGLASRLNLGGMEPPTAIVRD